MSLNAAALRILADKGLSAADIVELAEAMEVRRDPTAAERMRRHRAKKNGVTVTRNVTDEPPNEVSSNPKEEITSGAKAPSVTNGRAKPHPFPCPEGVDPGHWRDFLANRHRKNLAKTQTAYEGILSDIAKLADDEWPPGRLVQYAAAKGWGSINDPREKLRNGHHPQPASKPAGYRDPILGDAFDELHSRMAGRGDAERHPVPST